MQMANDKTCATCKYATEKNESGMVWCELKQIYVPEINSCDKYEPK